MVGSAEPANLGRAASLFFRLDGATCGLLAEAMLVLDPWLAELAAQRADKAVATDALSDCMSAADDVLGDLDGIWRTAPWFHDTVYHLSGNGVLKTVSSALGAIFRSQVLSQVDLMDKQPMFLAEHHLIADAIVAGQPTKARRLAHEHMQAIINSVSEQSPGLLDRVIEWR